MTRIVHPVIRVMLRLNHNSNKKSLIQLLKVEKRVHKAPQRYGFEDMVIFALITSSGDPLPYRDVEEMGSLQKKKIWESSSMLTKSVPTDKFKHCLDLIGVCSL